MNRYDSINIIRTKRGRRYRQTTKYPNIEKASSDIYIVGARHDRLDNLAYRYYGDSRLWWIIARANNIGKGDLNVPIGVQLRIPQGINEIVSEYNRLNS